MTQRFPFPDPVDEVSARLVAGGVVGLAGATLLLDRPWLLAPMAYGFGARVLAGPAFSPLGLLVTKVVRPRLPVAAKPVPGPPKRLAQGLGLLMSSTALGLAVTGRKRAGYTVLGGLLAAASLEAFAGYCLACRAFPTLIRAGLVPEDACERCADIWGEGRAA